MRTSVGHQNHGPRIRISDGTMNERTIRVSSRRPMQTVEPTCAMVLRSLESIASIAHGLQNVVPEARIAIAHGQMKERQLEDVMLDFVEYEFDVLVCTTIIESGLDIPNVNTIIINRADALGLAQLYQLRGRVGRDKYKAFGYLFYPAGRAITEDSQKRLRIIEEFTDLGAGFRIALRDLEHCSFAMMGRKVENHQKI